MPNPSKHKLLRSEYIYQQIRDSLRLGEFDPGQKIREIDICKRFEVSRTPAREALKRLLADGFLSRSSGGRLEVADIDLQQVEELFELREALEGLAARLAAKKADFNDILQLAQVVEDMKKEPKNIKDFFKLNDRFHKSIYAAAKNRYLQESINTVLNTLGLLRIKMKLVPLPFETSLSHHSQIFQAIERGDTEGAENAARSHIRESWRKRMELMSSLTGSYG